MSGYGEARKHALEQGHKHYVPERRCTKGHKALRFTASGQCVECTRVNQNIYNAQRRNNPPVLRLRADWSIEASYVRPGAVKSEDPVP